MEKNEKNAAQEIRLVRILGKDIFGNKKLQAGLMSIKGISWSFSNALCKKLDIDKNKRIGELNEKEIEKITGFMHNPEVPKFLKNRRNDLDSGEDKHLQGSDLDIRKDFDIKRLKKIKSYRGIRHTYGQPVRGQRTKSHFRTNRKKKGGVSVKTKVKK